MKKNRNQLKSTTILRTKKRQQRQPRRIETKYDDYGNKHQQTVYFRNNKTINYIQTYNDNNTIIQEITYNKKGEKISITNYNPTTKHILKSIGYYKDGITVRSITEHDSNGTIKKHISYNQDQTTRLIKIF